MPSLANAVPPLDFIPFAEQTGLVRQLSLWMFEEATRVMGALHAGLRLILMRVPAAFPEAINALTRLQVPSKRRPRWVGFCNPRCTAG